LKLWPQMSGVRIAKLVSSFSLLLLVSGAWASTYKQFAEALRNAATIAQVKDVAERFSDLLYEDPYLTEAVDGLHSGVDVSTVKNMVEIRAATETAEDKGAKKEVEEIKANPLYRDQGLKDQSNWFDGAIKRLMNLFKRPETKRNIGPSMTPFAFGWLVPVMWILLAAAVLVFGYFVFRHFSWKGALKRKAKAMLEDDEPERTLDEWLALADEHYAAGRYREAVRAMYLSCLLKFDEAGIARFIRGETNWEHLARIMASPKKPASIDFRPPTQMFDRIWYGYHVRGPEDVQQYRAWYEQISEALKAVKK
jgi:hypothetical protein